MFVLKDFSFLSFNNTQTDQNLINWIIAPLLKS